MKRGRRIAAASWACWLAGAALTAGCQLPSPEPPRPTVRIDPCAERLHDLCGHLLLYYSTHKKLPPKLAELESTDRFPTPPFACPVSGKPYVYDPDGLVIPGLPGRLVLYDSQPTHAGRRWGVLVSTIAEGKAITTHVVGLSQRDLAAATRKPTPEPGSN